MSFSLIPCLEDLAFVVSFEDIIKKLATCCDYQSGEKRSADVLADLADLTLARRNVINKIRASLSHHLVGRVGVKVR